MPYAPPNKKTLFSRKNAKAQRVWDYFGVFASWREKDSVVVSRSCKYRVSDFGPMKFTRHHIGMENAAETG